MTCSRLCESGGLHGLRRKLLPPVAVLRAEPCRRWHLRRWLGGGWSAVQGRLLRRALHLMLLHRRRWCWLCGDLRHGRLVLLLRRQRLRHRGRGRLDRWPLPLLLRQRGMHVCLRECLHLRLRHWRLLLLLLLLRRRRLLRLLRLLLRLLHLLRRRWRGVWCW